METKQKYLNRANGAAYVRDVLGLPCAPNTLEAGQHGAAAPPSTSSADEPSTFKLTWMLGWMPS